MISRISSNTIVNEATSPVLSEKLLVADHRHLVLHFILTAATLVAKVKVSNADDVDFSAPSTATNPWYFVDLKGLGDGATAVNGDVGISTTAATTNKAYAVNVDVARWLGVDITTLSAGSASVIASKATNE